MNIKTNNTPRDIIDGCELNKYWRKVFDYFDWEAIDNGEESDSFVKYKGQYYPLEDFTRCPTGAFGIKNLADSETDLATWHGYLPDSFFSGILIRFVEEDKVILGTYLG